MRLQTLRGQSYSEPLERRRLLSGSPAITINDVELVEGDNGASAYVFTVSLSNAGSKRVSVDFATEAGSARAGEDYAQTSGTMNFARGETSKTVTVLVNGDTTVEESETFSVKLRHARNAVLADSRGIGTIVNDDLVTPPPPTDPLPPSDDAPYGPYGVDPGYGGYDRLLTTYAVDLGAMDPSDINASGQVVGTSYRADGNERAFFWQNGVMTDLGTLGGPANYSRANRHQRRRPGGRPVGHQRVRRGRIPGDAGGYRRQRHARPVVPRHQRRRQERPDAQPGDDRRELRLRDRQRREQPRAGRRHRLTSWPSGSVYHAFRWQNGVMTDMGTFGGRAATPTRSTTRAKSAADPSSGAVPLEDRRRDDSGIRRHRHQRTRPSRGFTGLALGGSGRRRCPTARAARLRRWGNCRV